MEWMDDAAEAVCQELVKAEAKDKRAVKKWLSSDGPALAEAYKDKDPRHIRWAISDGIDRAVLRRHKTNLLTDFIDNF